MPESIPYPLFLVMLPYRIGSHLSQKNSRTPCWVKRYNGETVQSLEQEGLKNREGQTFLV
ncbi:MAG: hypothetical protein LBO67_08870 [Spirochaetaceae bacterium]|nr:hypothetical protein [Spirochaetaceae bacterium]